MGLEGGDDEHQADKEEDEGGGDGDGKGAKQREQEHSQGQQKEHHHQVEGGKPGVGGSDVPKSAGQVYGPPHGWDAVEDQDARQVKDQVDQGYL